MNLAARYELTFSSRKDLARNRTSASNVTLHPPFGQKSVEGSIFWNVWIASDGACSKFGGNERFSREGLEGLVRVYANPPH
ncbi:protein of unknown function [Methylocella tundrae]|uniref:Uncharacterized protein n=1 Tax=Methylocella tundrae TaxID=227605 RepID=A0A4U8Z004_METTU|nr:protein of unknown function [Methylocella tundrae]